MPQRCPTESGEGFSPALAAGIAPLERSRSYLGPGATWTALRLWREFAADPYRRLRVETEGCGVWESCGDPWEARKMLEGVLLALPLRVAKELRGHIDDEW
ncbi:hypothetical protein H074_01512 [Amycolatopsis decaplanina DSM 44594]|uniref:Uncharacterized protein n=1 Tax=Amycolatopsis decaplanina DSM 44594 TaxID=1284240 RepID=M2ZB42_9PSEU|nr:hypothetical protein H074_01512 [Amycolatopsis decaplanina DSM 44594]